MSMGRRSRSACANWRSSRTLERAAVLAAPLGRRPGLKATRLGVIAPHLLLRRRVAFMSERMDGLLDEANHQVEQLEALARHFEAMQARLASDPGAASDGARADQLADA